MMNARDTEILRQSLISAAQWNDQNGVWSDEDCDANGIDRMTVATALDIFTQWAKDEILADVNSGRVPNCVAGFAELHNHVDANCYGITDMIWEQIQGRSPERAAIILTEFVTSMQGRLDKWIKEGWLRSASADCL